MDLPEIANTRLNSQQIENPKLNSIKELVAHMGAMQAQDFAMAKWAVGLRMLNSSIASVEAAIDSGEIMRTHLLRPTWHLVSADDLHWMLELTAPQIRTTLTTRHRQLELTEALINRSNGIITKVLSGGEHLTREEIVAELNKFKIITDDNRSSHFLLMAELEGLICSGKTKGKKPTYALTSGRVAQKQNFTRDEALAELAGRYFNSHGPATLNDFIWWSGLLISDARKALEMIRQNLESITIDDGTYWFNPVHVQKNKAGDAIHLLPAFDEFIISYKDRKAALSSEHYKKVISNNGIFWPVIVLNGQVLGLWKRTISKNNMTIEVNLFRPLKESIKALINEKAQAFGDFLGVKMVFILK